jgi:hypothetical protein
MQTQWSCFRATRLILKFGGKVYLSQSAEFGPIKFLRLGQFAALHETSPSSLLSRPPTRSKPLVVVPPCRGRVRSNFQHSRYDH